MTDAKRDVRRRAADAAGVLRAALVGIGLCLGRGQVHADDPPPPPQSLGPLFVSVSTNDLRVPEETKLWNAAQKAKRPGRCPLQANFTVVVPGVPVGLDHVRERMLSDALEHAPSQYDFPRDAVHVDSRVVAGATPDVQVRYQESSDTSPPKVTLTTKPDALGCVVGGQAITVTITASEAGINSWQTGVQAIELDVNGARQGGQTYPNTQCDPASWTQTWTTTYTVPSQATVVSLQGKASDFNGNATVSDVVNLLPCVLVGSLDWSSDQRVTAGVQHFAGHVDLSLGTDAAGKLSGRATGTQTQKLDLSTCPSQTTTPGRVSARITGSRSGDSLALAASEVAFTPPDVTPCPQGGKPHTAPGIFQWPSTAEALKGLARAPDGGYVFDREIAVPQPVAPFTVHYRVILKPAKGPPVG